jgi:transcription antitermination protein NusB
MARVARRQARRRALNVLYEADVLRRDVRAHLEQVEGDEHAQPLDDFARALVLGIADHAAEIDTVISEHARGWRVGRMPVIDRNVLRLGVYELLFEADVPAAVAIDEAVELAKLLSTEDSPRYVNGVLSGVLRARGTELGAG